MNTQRLTRRLGIAALVAVPLGAVLSLRTAQAVRPPALDQATSPVVTGQDARSLLDRMYATYAAMHSFRCRVTSREDPLGTAQDADYEIERPNKIRFHRVTLIGPDLSGQALAVSDGHTFSVTCTENYGAADRYAQMPLEPGTDHSQWFTSYGGLGAWGTEPDAGMPDAALGLRLQDTKPLGLSAPEYSLGQPTVLDLPGVARPVAIDVVIAKMHSLKPLGPNGNDPEVVTYYIGRDDHLLYKLTAAYMVSATQWDTRTETYNDIEVDPKLPPADFVFTPPPGSHPVPGTNALFPSGGK